MTWKPKEKELTPAEAIALAKKELSPYWLGSAPKIAAVKSGDKFLIFSLDPQFEKKPWLILLVDVTQFSGYSALHYAKEWHRRYNTHHLGILLILLPVYQFLTQTKEVIKPFLELQQVQFPVVVDIDGGYSGAFETEEEAVASPKVLLLDKSKRFFEYSGQNNLSKVEIDIQSFLRASDPGLPLLPVFLPQQKMIQDVLRIELGMHPKVGQTAPFVEEGFHPTTNGYRAGQFHGMRPKSMKSDQIFLSGSWTQDSERIMTSDASAVIGFLSPSAVVSLIAQAVTKSEDLAVIAIEINGSPVTETFSGVHVKMDENGQSVLYLEQRHLHHILTDLPASHREITLRFPEATRHPVAIYGFRFGE
jgi:hypothetical protein